MSSDCGTTPAKGLALVRVSGSTVAPIMIVGDRSARIWSGNGCGRGK